MLPPAEGRPGSDGQATARSTPGPKANCYPFSYEQAAVLQHLSFEARDGETLHIPGPSGAGKTTPLNLIVRFYDPTSGLILFDGRDSREFRLADLYAKLANVTQAPFLFATMVRENIRAGSDVIGLGPTRTSLPHCCLMEPSAVGCTVLLHNGECLSSEALDSLPAQMYPTTLDREER
jgi:hypothetical protein